MYELPAALQQCQCMQKLILRQNWLSEWKPEYNAYIPHCIDVDLYENKFHTLEHAQFPSQLINLDLSFNQIKQIQQLQHLVKLRYVLI